MTMPSDTGVTLDPSQDAIDGRRARSQKSKDQIQNAMIDLVNQGILEPTALLVSEKAGVAIRSVFRHFEDMETLILSIHKKNVERYKPLVDAVEIRGPLASRLTSLITSRQRLYTSSWYMFKSGQSLMWKYKTLRQLYAQVNDGLRAQMHSALPQLTALSSESQNQVDLLLSFETWDRLTQHQGMSDKEAMSMIHKAILCLFSDDGNLKL